MSRHFLLTVFISSALLVASPLSTAGEEQRARSRGGSSSGRVSSGPSKSGPSQARSRSGSGRSKAGRGPSAPKAGPSQAARRRAPGPSGGAIASGGSKRRGAGGPSAQPSRRVRGGSSPLSGANVSAPPSRVRSRRAPGVDRTTSTSNRITRRTPGQTPQAPRVGGTSSVRRPSDRQPVARKRGGSRRRGSGNIRVREPATRGRSASARVRGGPRPVQTRGLHAVRHNRGSGSRRPRRNPIDDQAAPNVTAKRSVPSQRRRDMAAAATRHPPHTAIIPIAAGDSVDTTAGYYPHHYYPQLRYPGYGRPTAYGSGSSIQVPSDTTATLATRTTRTTGWDGAYRNSDVYGFPPSEAGRANVTVQLRGLVHFDGFVPASPAGRGHASQSSTRRVLIVTGEKVAFEEHLVPR